MTNELKAIEKQATQLGMEAWIETEECHDLPGEGPVEISCVCIAYETFDGVRFSDIVRVCSLRQFADAFRVCQNCRRKLGLDKAEPQS